jgi:HNH endonuclease
MPSGCLEWQAAIRKQADSRYGVFQVGYKAFPAHRVAYMIKHGDIPQGMVIMHTCDNQACVNVEHLVCTTQAENMRDKRVKGRAAKGIGHGMNKLTEEQVLEIRDMAGSQRDIAKMFGISQAMVYYIKRHKSWTHI